MRGTVVQLNISPGGILKTPILQAVVGPLGIEGDGHDHPKFHGGPTKALLLISQENITELTARGYPLFPGALGENITTSGLDLRQWRLGQRFRIGEIVIELMNMRVPCSALDRYGAGLRAEVYDKAVKNGDFTSPRWGLSGFYAAVLHPGTLFPGDIISLDRE